jgi:biopolymer transport protein ExbD
MAAHQHHGAERVYTTSRLSATSDMNITPMIDVLLVLLDLHGGVAAVAARH